MAVNLIRLIGVESAMKLMAPQAFGGKAFELPKGELGRGERAFAALADVVGEENARQLCKHFGGDRIYVPRCDALDLNTRNRAIVTAYNEGKSVWQLSCDFVLSDRQIQKILKQTNMQQNIQPELF
jgi:Mor family transcriptional regulator